ncbi:MAG: hypothetical protein E6G20_01865 [Actinobacteria bacterium]|nr:MAG: hypothetical protein E6G20_01865 [Actinomycetota bacterium]
MGLSPGQAPPARVESLPRRRAASGPRRREDARAERGAERGATLGRLPVGAREAGRAARDDRGRGARASARALDRGRGALLLSTHIGGWEVAMSLVPHIVPVPTTAIVTDDWLACAVEGLRIRAGLGIMYDSESAANAVTLLRRGEALLVLGDYAKEGMRTYAVRFLDAVAKLPAGHAVLARVCGAPVVPFSVLPLARRRWRIEVEPPSTRPTGTAVSRWRRSFSRSSPTGGPSPFGRIRSTGPPSIR